jgi:hypothetical protein
VKTGRRGSPKKSSSGLFCLTSSLAAVVLLLNLCVSCYCPVLGQGPGSQLLHLVQTSACNTRRCSPHAHTRTRHTQTHKHTQHTNTHTYPHSNRPCYVSPVSVVDFRGGCTLHHFFKKVGQRLAVRAVSCNAVQAGVYGSAAHWARQCL